MTERLIFLAQPLDNVSPNHIGMGGVELSPNDSMRRQEAISLISGVVKRGTRIFDRRGVQLTDDGRRVVIEVPSAERDCAGRIAPLVCYAEYDSSVGEALGSSVAVRLDQFAKLIGRSVLPEHLELARESFVALKKKRKTKKIRRVAATGAVAIVLVLLAYWLVSRGS